MPALQQEWEDEDNIQEVLDCLERGMVDPETIARRVGISAESVHRIVEENVDPSGHLSPWDPAPRRRRAWT